MKFEEFNKYAIIQQMKIDFSINYNIPEKISPLCQISHFIGIFMYVVFLMIFIYYCPEGNYFNELKELIAIVVSSGWLVTLAMFFIFVCCPIYFFINFIRGIFRYLKNKREFYSTPNIEYVCFNDDSIFFKNTCSEYDFSINKSDVVSVLLRGNVNTLHSQKGGESSTYVENFSLEIKTAQNSYIFYPNVKKKQIIQRKWYEFVDNVELYKQQIAFYKKYFDNIKLDINFSYKDTIY